MPRMFPSARRTRGLASSLALAVVLAGGGVAATVATSSAAYAQGKPAYTPTFVKVYEPVAAIVNKGGDLAAAKAQVPAIVAAVQSADDRNAAGTLILSVGTKLNDKPLERQGLELMVASGKVTPDKLGQIQYFIGSLAYDANDYPAALTAFRAAQAAGYTDENFPGVVAEAYFKNNQFAPGLQSLKAAIDQRIAAHTPVPEIWIKRGLQVAYDNKLTQQANDWSALLVANYPTPENWQIAVQVVNAVNPLDPQAQLDLLRLMALSNGMKQRQDFARYIEVADPRVMSNEVAKVLQSAVSAGALTTSDSYYQEIKRTVDQRTASDRADAPKLVAAARTAANGNAALTAGDVVYSIGDYSQAEQMYQLALQKGGVDKDKALTRLGIAQAQQGKNADARATFAQVAGARAPVARMWQAYVTAKA